MFGFLNLISIRDLGTPTVPSGFPGRASPKFPLGWRSAPREFPRVPRGIPAEDRFHESPRAIIFSVVFDAILQNEIWSFGAQRKKRKLNVENKMQFGLGFIDETKHQSVWCIPA